MPQARFDQYGRPKRVAGFTGRVYHAQNEALADDPRRFETEPCLLLDVIIQVTVHDQVFGNEHGQLYEVGVGETIGFTHVDLSTLYFANAAAGQNGFVTILGVEV